MRRSGPRRQGHHRRSVAAAGAVAALLAALTVLSGGTATAAPARATADVADARQDEGQAGYLAARLRENPVYVTDQAPRVTPRSAAPAFAKQAKRTGVPTYVMVLPTSVTAGQRELLARVHDRLGEDGLYLLLSGGGYETEAAAFGVDVPYEEANRAALYESPSRATSLEYFTRFVDVLRLGDAEAEARAKRAAEKYGVDSGREPKSDYVPAFERDEQSRRTGLLLGGVPLLIIGVGWYVHRRRGWRALHPVVLVAAAGASALAIGLVASSVYDQERTSGDPVPTAGDMRARTDRVAAGLRESPVYTDPESPRPFTSAQLSSLTERAAQSEVPVRVVVVPSGTDDESGGDTDWFVRGLHKKLGADAVYLVAHPSRPQVEMINFGAELDETELEKLDESVRDDATEELAEAEQEGGTGDASGLYKRLDGLVADLGSVGSGPPGEPYEGIAPEDPAEEDALPPLFSAELTSGAWEGAGYAALATGLVVGLGRFSARRRGARKTGTRWDGGAALNAPTTPGVKWLRRTARDELAELRDTFDRRADHLPDAARTRVWDCLDAATLLLDDGDDGDGSGDGNDDHGDGDGGGSGARGDRRDAEQATLIAALALLRAGRDAVRHADSGAALPDRPCGINPLHGPAYEGTRRVRRTRGAKRGKPRQVCDGCAALLDDPQTAHTTGETRLLRVRSGRGDSWGTPYNAVPGPLIGNDGEFLRIDQIVSNVRESAGVY